MSDLNSTLTTLIGALKQADVRDSDLTPDANAHRRADLRASAFTDARNVITTAAQTRAAQAEKTAQTAQQTALGQTNDQGRLVARKHAWERTQMLLDAGRDLTDVISTTDNALDLEAILEWAPTYVRASAPVPDNAMEAHHFTEPDTGWIAPAVISQLATVAPDPEPYTRALTAKSDNDKAQIYSDILKVIEKPGLNAGQTIGAIPGALMNRLHKADSEGYAAIRDA